MGIEPGSKELVSPAVSECVGEGDIEETLSMFESTSHRALAARAAFLGVYRPDIQFAVKEAC